MEAGVIRSRDINQELQESYLDYAMSVIVARALPDARDGLKPVHRRILYAMYDMGIRPSTPYKKSARIVGEVLGKYHPHGDMAVYDAMVRMAQDFSMRYELVDGQGNFGSIDGDSAAAMRYTEARMASIGADLLSDIDRNTVDFEDNFDGTLQEPSVLPSSFPNLLVNGASGIAVGMSTSIPPHNLSEVCGALIYMLENWDALDDVGVPELMNFIKGPDFPTGGVVYTVDNGNNEDQLRAAYATGRGKIKVRAKAHIEDLGRGRSRIIISEIPFQTNKTSLIERIAELVRSGRIEGITDLRDLSDRTGLRIVIDVSRTAKAVDVLADLFKLTPLQSTFGIIMLALVDGQPRLLGLKQALRVYLDHRLEVVRRRSEYDLARARERAHILEGLLIALDHLDEAIAIIRKSRTVDSAHANLRKAFKLSDEQAEAILQMQLRRLAALERRKLEDEYKEKIQLIKMLEALLQSPKMMRMEIARELGDIREKYSDPRRTIIMTGPATNIQEGDFLGPRTDQWVTVTEGGLVSRTYEDSAPRITVEMKDPPLAMMASNSSHTLYLFTEEGNAATVPVNVLQQAEDPEQGAAYTTVCPLPAKAGVTSAISLPPELDSGYLVMVTEQGEVKRLRLEDLPGLTANVINAMDVEKGDRLIWLGWVGDESEIILATKAGMAIRFKVADVRPTGLGAGGMRAVKLKDSKDSVVGAAVVDENANFWICTDTGVAKSTPMDEYPIQGRAGQGVITMKLPSDAKGLAVATLGRADDNIVLVTNRGKPKYMRVGLAPVTKRSSKGDYVISMRQNEVVARVVKLMPRLDVPEAVPEPDEAGAAE
ncbi:MAG TPA: DNA gyrase subunit A [Aggregatilinea sp.]|uniref:DNA gyrase subunit A n=1 Tax=Aggregatilinea sp. TaxID=2806333 RepID=UPI002CB37011|nr:DNA gyrase subunit A [Aggregatilinea sp.]HML23226.1 DNA gyrase subunit A [Aggregatilinea sp.]